MLIISNTIAVIKMYRTILVDIDYIIACYYPHAISRCSQIK